MFNILGLSGLSKLTPGFAQIGEAELHSEGLQDRKVAAARRLYFRRKFSCWQQHRKVWGAGRGALYSCGVGI